MTIATQSLRGYDGYGHFHVPLCPVAHVDSRPRLHGGKLRRESISSSVKKRSMSKSSSRLTIIKNILSFCYERERRAGLPAAYGKMPCKIYYLIGYLQ